MHKQAQEKLEPVGGLKPRDTILMPTRPRLAAGVASASRARNKPSRRFHNNGEGPSWLQVPISVLVLLHAKQVPKHG